MSLAAAAVVVAIRQPFFLGGDFSLREIKFKMYIYYYLRSMSIYEKYTNILKQNYTVAIA